MDAEARRRKILQNAASRLEKITGKRAELPTPYVPDNKPFHFEALEENNIFHSLNTRIDETERISEEIEPLSPYDINNIAECSTSTSIKQENKYVCLVPLLLGIAARLFLVYSPTSYICYTAGLMLGYVAYKETRTVDSTLMMNLFRFCNERKGTILFIMRFISFLKTFVSHYSMFLFTFIILHLFLT